VVPAQAPAVKTVARWAEVTPKDFTFDVKLHQALSRHSATLDALAPHPVAVDAPQGKPPTKSI
jgi:uncharacterized protein YecE (DUF72 family)